MSGCEDVSPYALQVLGDSMEPEFADGTIVVVDPGYPPEHGCYVVVDYEGETVFRQLLLEGERRRLKALNPAYPTVDIVGPYRIHGVVVQQTRRVDGKRQVKHYD